MNSCTGAAMWVGYLGIHEPLYFGWQFYVIFGEIITLIISLTAIYLTYIILLAAYSSVNLSSKLPTGIRLSCSALAAVTIASKITIGASVLISNSLYVNSFRHIVNILIVLTLSLILESTIIKLYRSIEKLYSGGTRRLSLSHVSVSKAPKSAKQSTSAIPVKIYDAEMSRSRPGGADTLTVDKAGNLLPLANITIQEKSGLSSLSFNRQHIPASADEASTGSKKTQITEEVKTATRNPRHVSRNTRKMRRIAKEIRNRLRLFIILIPVVSMCAIASLIWIFQQQARSRSETYSDDADFESMNYRASIDFTLYILVIFLACYQIYAHVPFDPWFEELVCKCNLLC